MNNLMQNNIKTMSSRELASLCNKAHDNVLKIIRSLIERGVVLNTIPRTYIHEQNGQRYTEFLSNKRDSFVIVARLSPEFTADVVDRWQELENQVSASSPVTPALPNFTDPYESALAWAEQYKAKEVAQAQITELQPKADALDALSHIKGSLGIRETANAVGIPERKFIARCTDERKPVTSRFMYRDDKGRLRAYAHRVKQGFMTQKITSYAGPDEQSIAAVQVKFTAAGVAHIAKMMQNKPAKQLRVM
ncbi:Rha family transcriptional regulator [Psychrobacter sp. BF1]|uniref:Rha family transcriptional regulator n=1 Tax=Psychrobacter sp. BF1 TaxID=2821147 RepID=UPI001C4E1B60|nr:phage regulatory protein/antirepressor Ant [Psychrobacter sp. BF1]